MRLGLCGCYAQGELLDGALSAMDSAVYAHNIIRLGRSGSSRFGMPLCAIYAHAAFHDHGEGEAPLRVFLLGTRGWTETHVAERT